MIAALHTVDFTALGLADYGKPGNYFSRQVDRWTRQYRASETGRIQAMETLIDWLPRHIPQVQTPQVSLVHGDYRLDNCMIGDDGTVAAVLDWEICTLGDPLADLGLLCVYWTDPGEAAALPQASPTALEGFMTKAEVLARYAEASGRDLSQIDYYIAYGYWKLACIMCGVYARYVGGAMGETDQRQAEGFANMVTTLASLTEEAAKKI